MSWTSQNIPKTQNQVKTIPIRDVSTRIPRFNVIGIVINKSPIKKFDRFDGPGSQKQLHGVLSFTIRDSACDWINGSYWGSYDNVYRVSNEFSIGDCVIVWNVRAKEKLLDTFESDFLARTPSGHHLLLNDTSSTISHYDFPDRTFTTNLKSTPIISSSEHVSLYHIIQTVHSNNNSQPGKNTSFRPADSFCFLAFIQNCGQPRALKVKRKVSKRSDSTVYDSLVSNKDCEVEQVEQTVVSKCEIMLSDETCSRFPMVLWNDDLIRLSTSNFISGVTIISVVDCPVRFDSFRRGAVAVPNSRTVFIISPHCPEADKLSQYMQKTVLSSISHHQSMEYSTNTSEYPLSLPMPSTFGNVPNEIFDVPLNSIHAIVNVRDIKEGKVIAGYAIVFALLSRLDLASTDPTRLVSMQCANCHSKAVSCNAPADLAIPAPGKPAMRDSDLFATCMTNGCPLAGQRFGLGDSNHLVVNYNRVVSLTDHTGTHNRCFLIGKAMSDLIGMQPSDFIALSVNRKRRLDWEFTLRRFKVYVWIEQARYNSPTPRVSIISCQIPNAFEVKQSLRS